MSNNNNAIPADAVPPHSHLIAGLPIGTRVLPFGYFQSVGVTSGPTRSNVAFAVLDQMTDDILLPNIGYNYQVRMDFSGTFAINNDGGGVEIAPFSGVTQVNTATRQASAAGAAGKATMAFTHLFADVVPGAYTYSVQWRTPSGADTATATGVQREMLITPEILGT